MYIELLDVLECPTCKHSLHLEVEEQGDDDEVVTGTLFCNDNHRFGIRHGVIDFGSVEQEHANNWSELHDAFMQDYDALDEEIKKRTPEQFKKQQQFVIKTFKNKLAEINPRYVLDVATGRGGLMRELLIGDKSHRQYICTDLSFDVLMYDRLKFKKINPTSRINFIACDASKLPIKDDTMDSVVSYYGIANMLNQTASGIRDAKRVLKKDGSLLNSVVYIKDQPELISLVEETCGSYGITGFNFYTEPMINKVYNEGQFHQISIDCIAEGVGEHNDLDLLPIEGQWYALAIIESRK